MTTAPCSRAHTLSATTLLALTASTLMAGAIEGQASGQTASEAAPNAQPVGQPGGQPAGQPVGQAIRSVLDGYRRSDALLAELKALAGADAEIVTIGRSREGRELVALRIGRDRTATKPAVLVTAGLDGLHLTGGEVALRVARRLLAAETREKHAAVLDQVTFWIIPCANPDALEVTLTGAMPQRGALRPVDDDRDGTADEDGPKDLNGDGVITEMRVKNPPLPFVATLVGDPNEPRLMKAPESGVAASAATEAVYLVLPEGVDADGDGRFAEDARGGVDLNRNFAHRYPELARDAGPHAMSEPESKALADFVIAHPEIVAAITYGRHDSLVKVPEGRDNDVTGRTPLVYAAGDIDLYQAIGKLYRETTAQARSGNADTEGTFFLWLANHRGVLSLASTVWGRPDLPKPEEAKPEESKPKDPAAPASDAAPAAPTAPSIANAEDEGDWADDALHPAGLQTAPATAAPQAGGQTPPAGGRGRRGGGGGVGRAPGAANQPQAAVGSPGASDPDAAEWLAYSDRMRGGAGFAAWSEVDHPQFGRVEVGGFHPLFKLNAPASEWESLAEKQTSFLIELAARLPVLTVTPPTVTSLGSGLYRIETAVLNQGRLPTHPAMGVATRERQPIIARLSAPVEQITSGERIRRIDALPAGGRVGLEWIVRAAPGEAITLSIGNNEYGVQTATIVDGVVRAAEVSR